ncbi:MAG: extracellular solute-binding protein [Clostridia bacterium]|nr:extracellular solute-binding protein [Clostridia bacterium]
MKRAVSFLLAVVMVFTLCSCSLFPEPSSVVEKEEDFEYYEGKNKTSSKSDTSSKKDKKDKSEGSVEVEVSDNKGNSSGGKTGSDNSSNSSGSSNSSSASQNGNSSSEGSNADFIPKDEPLDLSGKTVTVAVTEEPQYHTTSFRAMISAFETKYGCTVKEYTLSFGSYNTQIKQRKSTGDPYDICYVHGSNFPAGPQLGLYADLTDYLYEMDTSNFDMDKTNSFKWGIRSYGVCNTYSAYPYVFYYNKALFGASGLQDPRTLYNNGAWTWDKIFEQGKAKTSPASNVYYLSSNIVHTNFYGVSSATIVNGKPQLNLGDSKTIASLRLIQRIYCSDAIGKQSADKDSLAEFIAGRNYMFVDDSSKYPNIYPMAKSSSAFNSDPANLGIVPIPLPAENTEQAYPTGWHIAISAGEGSDPRIALTWAQFVSSYKSTVRGSNELPQADQALMDSIMEGTTVPNRQGVFKNGYTDTLTLYTQLTNDVRYGEDVNSVVDRYYHTFSQCIAYTYGSNNFEKN